MRAPAGLKAPGRRAWKRALLALGDVVDDRFWDAAARYSHAVDLAELVRSEWEAAGSPLTLVNTNGVIGGHPLLKVLAIAERDAARFGAAVGVDPASAVKRGPRVMVEKNTRAPDRLAAAPARLARVA